MRRMYSEQQLEEVTKKVIESGTTENAKPIYWHGIEVAKTTGEDIQINMVLLLNDNTPINTVDKLIDKIVTFGDGAFINIDGFYNLNNEKMSNATILYYSAGANIIYIIGNDYQCLRKTVYKAPSTWKTFLNETPNLIITDRINKLN